MNQQELLDQGLQALGIDLPKEVQKKLLDYIALIAKWNKVHNLTAVRAVEEMVGLHLVDSLAVLPYLDCKTLLDVGSGAGLPGIPLALARPDIKVTVLDSSHKKTTFQRQAKAELGIHNLEVVCSRVEQFRPSQRFDCIISRAFSDIGEFLKITTHLLKDDGHWLAMKGVYPHEELSQAGIEHAEVIPLRIPGLDVHRHLVRIKAKK